MLSISAPLKGSGRGEYYLSLAKADYYLNGGEPLGSWYGSGATSLDLSGEVSPRDFRFILAGFDPRSGEPLVQNAGDIKRQSGWDLTFSAPKTVSVVWGLSGDVRKELIRKAHERSVKKALDFIEIEAGITRRGKLGKVKQSVKLVYALFEHGTSRALDPQLHTHAVLSNLGFRSDGTTGTLETKTLFRLKMAAGAIYRSELDRQLQLLGLKTVVKNGSIEIDGISDSVAKALSKRRDQIEEYLSEMGFQGPIASRIAAENTRQAKQLPGREVLFKKWAIEGEKFFLTKERIEHLFNLNNYSSEAEINKEDVAKVLDKMTTSQSHFAKRDFIRALSDLTLSMGIGAEKLLNRIKDELKSNSQIVALRESDSEIRYTTKEILRLENEIIGFIDSTTKLKMWEIEPQVVTSFLQSEKEKHSRFSEEHFKASEKLLTSPGQVQLLSGYAGSGKSSALGLAATVWKKTGFRLLGAAPSGIAASGLGRSANIESFTIHKLLDEIESEKIKIDKRTILIIDEAGMIGTRQLHKMLKIVSPLGAKIILAGDDRQLQSIEAGGGFSHLFSIIEASELREVGRQKDEWARQSVIDLAEGRAARALREYAKRGLISVSRTRRKALEKLLSDWGKQGSTQPEDHLIIAPTNFESELLNLGAQSHRQQLGLLENVGIKLKDESLYVGDRILFTRNSNKLGVKNGTIGTITSVDKWSRSIKVKLSEGKEVLVDLNRYSHIRLGYAITTHRAQGITVPHCYVLAGGALQDKELGYVQGSRSVLQTKFYIDETSAGEDLKSLINSMNRSRKKEFALTLSKVAHG